MNTKVDHISSEQAVGILDAYYALDRGKRILISVFLIWLVQAVPKWSMAILASDEMSAQIMKLFISPL